MLASTYFNSTSMQQLLYANVHVPVVQFLYALKNKTCLTEHDYLGPTKLSCLLCNNVVLTCCSPQSLGLIESVFLQSVSC